jgi:hypothetical protein
MYYLVKLLAAVAEAEMLATRLVDLWRLAAAAVAKRRIRGNKER